MKKTDPYSFDLFTKADDRAGTLACGIEIVATLNEALDKARTHGVTRETVAERMGYHLGEKLSVATLNGYAAQSHNDREISLVRAMAFDAALGADVLLGLYARKRGERAVVSQDDAATIAHFGGLLLPVDSPVAIGWTYDGINFAAPTTQTKTLAEVEEDFIAAVSGHLDATVHARGYDNIVSCASYAASTNTTFKAEATAAIAWRDAVWGYCYAQLAKVQAATRSVPSSTDAFINELPTLTW